MARFVPGMFRTLRAAITPREAEVPTPKPPEPLSPEARARRRWEEEEAARIEEQKRMSEERIRHACQLYGSWFPGDFVSQSQSRLSPKGRLAAFVERVFG